MVFIGCHSGLDSSRVVVVIIQESKKHLGKKESAKLKSMKDVIIISRCA